MTAITFWGLPLCTGSWFGCNQGSSRHLESNQSKIWLKIWAGQLLHGRDLELNPKINATRPGKKLTFWDQSQPLPLRSWVANKERRKCISHVVRLYFSQVCNHISDISLSLSRLSAHGLPIKKDGTAVISSLTLRSAHQLYVCIHCHTESEHNFCEENSTLNLQIKTKLLLWQHQLKTVFFSIL